MEWVSIYQVSKKMADLGFWGQLEKPIIGLAPMDGVTDAAYRHMVCKYSNPSFVFTEFVNVEGLAHGSARKLSAFLFEEAERPIVAQIFGITPDSFYKAALLVCALGFDGVDINMGCPAKKVERKGSGAGLIKNPKLAGEIIAAVKKGVRDWSEGITLKKGGVHEDLISECRCDYERKVIPVSVKTRIGYDKPVTEEWVSTLLESGLDLISVHGRTLKQMYIGEADWEEIGKAAKICKDAGVMILGNGDIDSMEDAQSRIDDYGVDGVMAGRAIMGNPWFFGGDKPGEGEEGKKERLGAALEHVRYYRELNCGPFHDLKKHLGWYLKGFDGVRDLRVELMGSESFEELEKILMNQKV